MPRMQDTAEEPSPSPSTRAGGCGTASLGAEAAWPESVLSLQATPLQSLQRCYFCFSFSAFLTSWGLSKAGLPRFHLSTMEQLWGAELCPHTPGMSLCSNVSPCYSMSPSR